MIRFILIKCLECEHEWFENVELAEEYDLFECPHCKKWGGVIIGGKK